MFPCCTTTPVVTFDSAWFTTFTTIFPEFSCLTQAQVQAYFTMAGLYVANDVSNPAVCILPQLFYLVTAHVAWLLCPKGADGNPSATGTSGSGGLVGRITNATQGSVNVGLDMGAPGGASPQEAWWDQTKYGAAAFASMAAFRTARYTVSPTNVGGPFFPGAPWLPINFWGPVTGLN